MKPGLAVLPLEVWADILVFPWITRQELAEIVDKIGDRNFTVKLQFRLHDMGKLTLRHLSISFRMNNNQLRNSKYEACLVADHDGYKEYYELPESEMPQNIKNLEQLTVSYLDDEVLDFLEKIKSLLNNVHLFIESAENMQMWVDHLFPMLGNVRKFTCNDNCKEDFERHFPTLTLMKTCSELDEIPAHLDWLSAARDFDVHGPRFLQMEAQPSIIVHLVNAVRKNFLEATTSSAFVVYVDPIQSSQQQEHPYRSDEFKLENGATNEQLVVRNAVFKVPNLPDIQYVQILRHPMGADAKMEKWMSERAFYEKKYTLGLETEQMISIGGSLTIGQITKNRNAINDDELADDDKSKIGQSQMKNVFKWLCCFPTSQ